MVSSARTFWGLPKLCHILLLFGLTCCVSLHIVGASFLCHADILRPEERASRRSRMDHRQVRARTLLLAVSLLHDSKLSLFKTGKHS